MSDSFIDVKLMGKECYPPSFYFSIPQTEQTQQLFLTNQIGDKAHFQDEPYLSVKKISKPKLSLSNPTKGFVIIRDIEKSPTVTLFSISGKQVLPQKLKTQQII